MQKYLTLMIMMMSVATIDVWAAEKADLELGIIEARVYLAAGETEKARDKTEALMIQYPDHPEVRGLMSDVIDREIAQEDPESAASGEGPSDISGEEKQLEIDRWLERARTLQSYQQYEQATLAAEKVFQYDPQNVRASRLIDELRHQALDEGGRDVQAIKKSAREESRDRVARYLRQAQEGLKTGRYGAARLACDKVLILDPTQEEAIAIKNQIRNRLGHEAGKTL